MKRDYFQPISDPTRRPNLVLIASQALADECDLLDLVENAMVKTIITYNSLADLETVIQMGMKDSLTVAMENLDELLLTL